MSVILLRKMTEKSVIPDGKNKGMTVGDLLITSKASLIYTYFTYELLTFTDDILKKLNIRQEDYIAKPGKAPEKAQYYIKRNVQMAAETKARQRLQFVKMDDRQDPELFNEVKERMVEKIKRKRSKTKMIASYKAERFLFSKARMQTYNHGHFRK